MKRPENARKLSNSLEHCLLKGVLNVGSSLSLPQGRQGPQSPSKTPPQSSRMSPMSSTPLIPTQPELDLSLTPKLVILSQDGRLMQYHLGHDLNQPPDQVLRLGPSSTAAAREGVDRKHWLLSIVSRGSHAPSRSRSLSKTGWSRKLSLKADSKRHTSEMLLVFDDICMLEEWSTIIRKAIEAASGVPYLLGLVSQSSQAERNWLDLVTMPFKPLPPNVSGGDAACTSRGSTSTSLSSYHDVEWNASVKHASSGSGSSVYTNTELDNMRQSRSSSYSSAQASSQTSLGNSDELPLRQQKPIPNLPQALDAGELLSQQDAPQILDLQAIAAPPDTRRRSISCSPKILIPQSERTPTLAPEAVHLMTGNQLLGDELHSPDESLRAATMEDWLDNPKAVALKPGADRSPLESTTPSSAIFRDFEFSWGETEAPSREASQLDHARRYPSSTIHIIPDSEHDVQTKSMDSGSIATSIFTMPSFNTESRFATRQGLLSPALKGPIPEFSPTLAAFPQPATWQPVQRPNDDNFSDGGSKLSGRPMTPPSLSRAKPVRTVSSDSSLPMPLLQAPACSALHMRRRKTMPTSTFRGLPPAGPPPQAHLPPLPDSARRGSGAEPDNSSPQELPASKGDELPTLPIPDIPSAHIPVAVTVTTGPSSSHIDAPLNPGAAGEITSSSPSSFTSSPSPSPPQPLPLESLSQRSSTQTPLPPAEAIAELALQLSILTSGPAALETKATPSVETE